MTSADYNPFGTESVQIKFKCNNCEAEVISERIGVPSPDYSADSAGDSFNENDGFAVCEVCEKEYEITVWASFASGYIDVQDISDEDVIEVIEHPEELDEYIDDQIDAILNISMFIEAFKNEIENLKKINEIYVGDNELQKTLQRQLFSSAITCLEDYLSSTLINEVLNNEENFKRFVRTFHGIRDRKFNLSEIYEKMSQLEDIVKKELIDVIYHDLPKVKGMYKDTLEIELPDISELMKIIQKRHDMVHRNGKDKEGNQVEINKDIITDTINTVYDFVKEIDFKLKKKL
jgi:uncharacterized protein YqgV (UPF0045/DUF77 family)/transcription elongation factor Elf1